MPKKTNISKLIDDAIQARVLNSRISDIAQFLSMKKDLNKYLKEGVTIKFIYQVLSSEKVIEYSYSKFARLCRKYIKNNDQVSEEVKATVQIDEQKAEVKISAVKEVKPVSNKSFKMQSTPDKEDLL